MNHRAIRCAREHDAATGVWQCSESLWFPHTTSIHTQSHRHGNTSMHCVQQQRHSHHAVRKITRRCTRPKVRDTARTQCATAPLRKLPRGPCESELPRNVNAPHPCGTYSSIDVQRSPAQRQIGSPAAVPGRSLGRGPAARHRPTCPNAALPH